MPPGGSFSWRGQEKSTLPKSVSSSHAYQSDSVLRRQREATSVGLMSFLSLKETIGKPSPHSSVLSWKSVRWTWTSGKSVSKVTTFMDIMTWLLVVTEHLSPSTSAAFPVPELCPLPSPHPQPQRKSVLSVPALDWSSSPVGW